MSHHILLVEDDISIQEMVQKYLIKEGFQVTIASDGEGRREHIFTRFI